MADRVIREGLERPDLNPRQAAVLRAVVTAYVGEGGPVGSLTLSHLLSVNLSSASIRSVLAELSELGLVEQPHKSAGRLPTDRGLRCFVDALLDPDRLAAYEERTIAYSVDDADPDRVIDVASKLLSERTRQLGFVLTPRLGRLVLRHVSLVRVASRRVLVVLVSMTGSAHRCVIDDETDADQAELDRIAGLLNERVEGRTLREVRDQLAGEARTLRHRAGGLLERAVAIGRRALAAADDESGDIVIATRLALLDQPEFRDSRRVRDLFSAVETQERLVHVLDQMLRRGGVCVAFGDEVDEPALHRCALVATHYGGGRSPLGVMGVIGPSRMDFERIIPLVGYLSRVVTERLYA